MGGGAASIDDYINEYENGLEIMYGEGILGGSKSTKKHKKTYGKKKSNTKRHTRRNKN